MNGVQKVIKYCAIAFATFLSVIIFTSIIAAIMGVAAGVAGVADFTDEKERVHLSEQYSAEETASLGIQRILVDCTAEVVVEQGEVLSIEASDVTDEYEIRCANGTFSIIQDRPSLFMFRWMFRFGNVAAREKVVVTIPEGFRPEELTVRSGSGMVSVERLETGSLLIHSGSGRVLVDEVTTGRLYLDSGSGRMNATNLNASETELDTGSGRVTIEEAKLGSLKLNSGSGAVSMKNVTAEAVRLDSGSGSVGIIGTLTGKCEFETGSGSLTLSLAGREEDYRIEADCGSGTFRINGRKVEDGSYGQNVKGELEIDSGSGSVSVEFLTPDNGE